MRVSKLFTLLKPTLSTLCAIVTTVAAQAADVDLTRPPPKVATRTPIPMDGGATDRVVEFALWKSALLVNDVVGQIEHGLFCSDPVSLRYTKKVDDWIVGEVTRTFKEQSVGLGFSRPETTHSVFDDKAGASADFRVGATLMEFDYRICGREDVKGDAYAKIKWEVFSTRRQKVVYTATIESSYSAAKSVPEKDFDKGLMQAVVGNLFGDPAFADVIRSGGVAQDEPAQALVPLRLDPGPSVTGGVGRAAPKLLAAVVTIESGVASGSGFYVSQDGYLLTNYHVVADAKFVRVKLAGGRSMVGEVLRVDKQRDVALVRTDPVASGVLALRHADVQVGEEVYALGSPFGEVLSGTLTRGVLSSKRVFEGVAYLQSDVAVNPGNSGGPLIDANGQVVGIAQLRSNAQGINMFIPIDDALDKLALTLQAKPQTAQAK